MPDVLTKAHAKMQPKSLARSMAKDQHDIERILAYDSIPPTHCVHDLVITPDEAPATSVTASDCVRALVLYSLSEEETTGLERARTMKAGWLTGASNHSSEIEYVNISRRVAMNAKRAFEIDWKFKVASGTSVNICQSKVGRGQLGPYTHELCLKDLAKNCSRKVLLVNDFIRASGEIGVASVAAKVSEEAVGNNCNVCYWGLDFRPTFAEVSKARIKTELGRHYLNGQLSVPGKTPVQAPADPQGIAKKDIKTLLPQQLKHLSIDADGDIVLPLRLWSRMDGRF